MNKNKGCSICETCIHYKPEFAPYIKRMVMTCELPKRNVGCVGNYIPKEDDEK